ncbi:hypothetical protein HNQ79_006388 [Streptomyces candidus]|uniref:Uncharacterized protein n=1 Tax=Streptomyces candidus TaxID=67283 RepID=A0A7X0LUA0_9ACTN|nr:hypothetical protein [Streptomyces candidus]
MPLTAGDPAVRADGRCLTCFGDQDLGAGVAAVGGHRTQVPVPERGTDVTLAAFVGHRDPVHGVGQGRCLGALGRQRRRRGEKGSQGQAERGKAASKVPDHPGTITARPQTHPITRSYSGTWANRFTGETMLPSDPQQCPVLETGPPCQSAAATQTASLQHPLSVCAGHDGRSASPPRPPCAACPMTASPFQLRCAFAHGTCHRHPHATGHSRVTGLGTAGTVRPIMRCVLFPRD